MEAEWEYAARAGTRTSFYTADITSQETLYDECCQDEALDPIAWYCVNASGSTHPVGTKLPNAWGLYDMLGNVAEWVNDGLSGSTPPGPVTDRGGLLPSKPRSLTRGGGYRHWPSLLRASNRALSTEWKERSPGLGIGFRLVRSL
ncbi:MAG: SUMF1/EgtB/PvdO family nonheme iron enzyme [Labilithrix sp.]|nr:SUMF1/EgtB/PvdO family nonheme iron enzyme [Labilithrix sp.]MCW5812277.1 SUMF1/EgtB/PvdO family nonheme iron enzyme [Labilithrix sp.]